MTAAGFDAVEDEARRLGVHWEVWDRSALGDQLGDPANADLRGRYFGEPRALDATVAVPLALDRSRGRDVALVGRDADVVRLRSLDGRDALLVGVPGVGKTRLVLEAPGVRYLSNEADADGIADSLRRHRPPYVAVDDAGLHLARLHTLLELRRAGYRFGILATAWPEHRDAVARLLPGGEVVELPLLEREHMDAIARNLGITNYYLRRDILAQAEGRPGWAVSLADLALAGGIRDVLTGSALIAEVEPHLQRVGSGSTHALGFLAVVAALGSIPTEEMGDVLEFLGIDRLQGSELVLNAAAAGLLNSDDDRLAVAPRALRHALVARWFFEMPGAWRIDDVTMRWPAHRTDVLAAVVAAAGLGSIRARAHLDRVAQALGEMRKEDLEAYVTLDETAAARAVSHAGTADGQTRFTVLSASARRFALPEAVRGLLDLAVDDERPEPQNPDHPVRLLGEIGSRVDPNGQTTYDARAPLLATATAWFDEEPTEPRSRVWASLVAHLLDPAVAGNHQDLGSPARLQLQSGYESPEHVDHLIAELWPPVEARLPLLKTRALVAFTAVLDAWLRVARGMEGPFGVVPGAEVVALAGPFSGTILDALTAAAESKPGAQVAIDTTARLFGARARHQTRDAEFRILTWRPWRLLYRWPAGRDRIARIAAAVAERWASEDPAAVVARVRLHVDEARRAGRLDLEPMLSIIWRALADRGSVDLDAYVQSGLEEGLTSEIGTLMALAYASSQNAPTWFATALAGAARPAALAAALVPSAPEAVARAAIDALGEDDHQVVTSAMWGRAGDDADTVALALLTHPVADVRGRASLWFAVGPDDHGVRLPDDSRVAWRDAFAKARVGEHGGEREHRLGEILDRLVDSDGDLVERWLATNLREIGPAALFRLPGRRERALSRLPRPSRDRLIRDFSNTAIRPWLLAALLGDDVDWAADLTSRGVVPPSDVLHALSSDSAGDDARVSRVVAFAPALLGVGVSPEELASTLLYGVRMGEESARHETVRAAFERSQPTTVEGAAVRDAGLRIFAAAKDDAAARERENRVRGEP